MTTPQHTASFKDKLVATSLAALMTLGPTSLVAQTNPTQPASVKVYEPTQRQIELNKKALTAFNSARYDQAIQYFQDSLTIQPLNITYLNIGRAFYRNKQCLKAENAYLKAIDPKTPQVSAPSLDKIDQAIKRYIIELKTNCPAYLTITCSTGKMSVYINNEGPKPCPGKRAQYAPGKYEIYGELDGQKTNVTTVNLERLKQNTVQLGLKIIKNKIVSPDKIVKNGDKNNKQIIITPPPNVDKVDTSNVPLAITLVTIGVASVVGAMAWETCGFKYASRSTLKEDRMKMTMDEFQRNNSWCFEMVNGEFDGHEIAAGTMYLGGAILVLLGLNKF